MEISSELLISNQFIGSDRKEFILGKVSKANATSRVEYLLTQIIIKMFYEMRLGHRIELN